MKTKTTLLSAFAVAVAVASLITACNKTNSAGSNSTSSGNTPAQIQTESEDQTQVSNEMDASVNDVNNALNTQAAGSGNSATSYSSGIRTLGGPGGNLDIDYSICDGTVTMDTANGLRQVIITYNGNNCRDNRIRTGVVVISIPVGVRWRDTGAVVTVDFQNLKITRVRDGKTITFNGTYTYTNITGGLLADLATRDSITHTITADSISIEFADSATRVWSVSKQRVFTYNDGVVITTTGTHSDGTNTDVSVWGTNRYGNSFETLITQPKVIAQSCDYRLTSGQNEIIRPALTATITYGLDVNGNPTSCPGAGTYYYKVVWTINGKTYTYIAPY